MQILICDDDEGRAGDWCREIQALEPVRDRAEVRRAGTDELLAAIDELEVRRAEARGEKDVSIELGGNLFDDADILIVDYDLIDLQPTLTGESLSYLARCYSRCGLIVGVNQQPTERWFDLKLTDLRESWADVSVGTFDLDATGLWEEPSTTGYRPWAWPLLLEAAKAHEERVAALRESARADVLSLLGFDERTRRWLPRDCFGFVQPREQPPESETAVDLDGLIAGSRLGLKPKDELCHPDSRDRIAAARLTKWLEAVVLPRQDVLVDAPHLAVRLPGLLAGEVERTENWQQTCLLHRKHDELGLNGDGLDDHRFPGATWMSRPTWLWPSMSDAPDLPAWRRANGKLPDLVFCEDTSSFEATELCRRFLPDLTTPFIPRWVRRPEEEHPAAYEPGVQFALA